MFLVSKTFPSKMLSFEFCSGISKLTLVEYFSFSKLEIVMLKLSEAFKSFSFNGVLESKFPSKISCYWVR